jgi:hypothetical protein
MTMLPQHEDSGRQRRSLPQRPSRGLLIAGAAVVVLALAAGGYELTRSHASTPAAPAPVVVASKPPVSHAPASPLQARLHQVIADAKAKQSMHLQTKDRSRRLGAMRMSDDDATETGIQRISRDGGHVTIRVLPAATFVAGDHNGLTKYLGFSPSMATALRGHWLRLLPGQPNYASVTDAITLSSALKEVGLRGHLRRLAARRKDGQRVYGIEGRPTGKGEPRKAHATLWVSAGRDPLPVEWDERYHGTTEVARFTRWGHPVRVTVPGGDLLGETGSVT